MRLSARQVGHAVEVGVLDSGIGMNAHALDNVCDAFYQVANPARNARMGHGVGLAIVKGLSDLLHLALLVDSSPGKGSCFTLYLSPAPGPYPGTPITAARTAARTAEPSADRLRGRLVLVIEDHLP